MRSSKFQVPSSKEAPNSNLQSPPFGNWSLGFIWSLELGTWSFLLLIAFALPGFGAEVPVSYYQDLVPILKRSCTGCHHPGKLKGQLDLTTYESLKKGGKHG